jgi:hypothetical protein
MHGLGVWERYGFVFGFEPRVGWALGNGRAFRRLRETFLFGIPTDIIFR